MLFNQTHAPGLKRFLNIGPKSCRSASRTPRQEPFRPLFYTSLLQAVGSGSRVHFVPKTRTVRAGRGVVRK